LFWKICEQDLIDKSGRPTPPATPRTWADEAYPLAPKELVDDWKERLEKVNKMAIK